MNIEENMVHRGITLRVRPGSRTKHNKMMRIAGACRKVWNEGLEICERQYQDFKAGEGDKPSVTFFSLCKLYVQVKQELPWLGALPSHTVHSTVKHLAEASKRFLDGAGRPVWKQKFKDTPRFTVPDNIKIKGKKIYIPKLGWVKLTGKNPYAGCKPKQATFKYEAGNWYVSILYEVPDHRPVRPGKPITPLGIDRNVGQVALSTGVRYELPALLERDAKLRRLQKQWARQQYKRNGWQHTQLRIPKIYRAIRNVIKNWCHQTSRIIADIHDLVIFEDLNIQGMTKSARGSRGNPGKNVAQKRGLNRAILRSGWGRLERYMSYKTYTEKIDPKYTSQRCHNCGEVRKANRKSQSVYHCSKCDVEKNADVNAALNIRNKWLYRDTAFGDGASAGGDCNIGWSVKPENVYDEASRPVGPVWIRI